MERSEIFYLRKVPRAFRNVPDGPRKVPHASRKVPDGPRKVPRAPWNVPQGPRKVPRASRKESGTWLTALNCEADKIQGFVELIALLAGLPGQCIFN